MTLMRARIVNCILCTGDTTALLRDTSALRLSYAPSNNLNPYLVSTKQALSKWEKDL